MKVQSIQFVAALLSVLLFTTFGHELLHANRHHHETKKIHSSHAIKYHNKYHHNYRANDDQDCTNVCFSGGETSFGSLNLIIDNSADIVVVYNASASVAWVIDFKASIHALFDGTTGRAIVVDFKSKVGYDTANIWFSRDISITAYFGKLTSLKLIFQQAKKNGTYFKESGFLHQISKETTNRIITIFKSLTIEFRREQTIDTVRQIIFNRAQRWRLIWVKQLRAYFEYHGKVNVQIAGDLTWLLNVFDGFGNLLEHINADLETLKKYSIKFRFEKILTTYYGLEAFIIILEDIAARASIAEIFGDFLKDTRLILNVIVLLGGNISVGLNGVFNVIYHIAETYDQNNNVTVHNLVRALIVFGFTLEKSWNVNYIRSSIKIIINIIQEQIKKYQSTEFEVLLRFFRSFTDRSITFFGGIIIYDVLEVLDSFRNTETFKVIVRFLLAIKISIKVAVSVPFLVLGILEQLSTHIGARIATAISGIKWEYKSSGEIDIIATIRKNLKLSDYQKFLKDIPKLLLHIPVISQIIGIIEKHLKEESKGEYSLDDILHCRNALGALVKIQAWLKTTLQFQFSGHGIWDLIFDRHRHINKKSHEKVKSHEKSIKSY